MSTGASNGTFQHALMLSRACARLDQEVTLVDIRSDGQSTNHTKTQYRRISYRQVSVAELSPASLNIIVGLWDEQTTAAAHQLSSLGARLVLAPTVYWDHNALHNLPHEVEALWYVSWDQASYDGDYWHVAKQVEVIRCVVDTDRFRLSGRPPTKQPWLLGRHSRDVPAKFSPDIAEYVSLMGETHDIRFRMLGAAHTMKDLKDDRVVLYDEDEIQPEAFLAGCDVWVFAHAAYWRETACVAMLEAMASGLPVVVQNVGGIREYVQHGRTGFLCNDLEELVRYTSLLLDRPHLRSLIGTNARTFVEKFHSLERLADQIRPTVYDENGER
jgi:glycosyltransferase involved in cell wall biosynthesis